MTNPGIIGKKIGDYDVLMLDDGTDYWSVAQRLLPTLDASEQRTSHRHMAIADVDGRRYVFKRDATPVTYWECKLSRLWYGPVYSKIMRETHRALAEGCDIIQPVYLVAERMENGLAKESITLLGYIPGESLYVENPFALQDRIRDAISRLHQHRIASVDPNPGNFILNEQGLHVIDLSFRDGFAMGRAKDHVYLKDVYEIDMPDAGLLNRFLIAVVRANRYLKYLSRRLRGHPGAKRGLQTITHWKKKPDSGQKQE